MKNKKQPYIDDGHTVYDMSGLNPQKKNVEKERLSSKEKRAAFRAAVAVYGPILIGMMLCFAAAMGIIALWLR